MCVKEKIQTGIPSVNRINGNVCPVSFAAISVILTLVDGNSHLFINFLIRQHNWHNSDIDWIFI